MRINRVYQAAQLKLQQTLLLDEDASNHLGRVLRMQINDPLVIFNGDGHDYGAVITAVNKKSIEVKITACHTLDTESPLRIHLVQGVARGEKMDFIIQKAVELGVTDITPVLTEYGNVKLDAERLDKKQQHWQKVAISACEQCQRAYIPTVHEPQSFKDWVVLAHTGLKLILHPYHSHSIQSLQADTRLTLLVGPEGGLSDREVTQAQAQGFTALKLGPRILRTETAALVAMSMLQSAWGDLR